MLAFTIVDAAMDGRQKQRRKPPDQAVALITAIASLVDATARLAFAMSRLALAMFALLLALVWIFRAFH